MNKYGVDVVSFIPGSFPFSSNIMARQALHAAQMRGAMDSEQLGFYGEFFDRYNSYLNAISGEKEPQMVDTNIIETFESALLDVPARSRYMYEPLRYTIYHFLFKITPQILTDFLLYKFVALPEYDPEKSVKK